MLWFSNEIACIRHVIIRSTHQWATSRRSTSHLSGFLFSHADPPCTTHTQTSRTVRNSRSPLVLDGAQLSSVMVRWSGWSSTATSHQYCRAMSCSAVQCVASTTSRRRSPGCLPHEQRLASHCLAFSHPVWSRLVLSCHATSTRQHHSLRCQRTHSHTQTELHSTH